MRVHINVFPVDGNGSSFASDTTQAREKLINYFCMLKSSMIILGFPDINSLIYILILWYDAQYCANNIGNLKLRETLPI